MKHEKLLTLLAAGALLAGCAEDPQRDGNGQLTVDFSTSAELNVVNTRAGEGNLPGGVQLPAPEDFTLQITGDGGFVKNFTTIPTESVTLEVGNYTAIASCGDLDEEGFGKPAFGATEDFAIEWNQETSVPMTAKLTNMAVSIDPADALTSYFSDYSIEISRGAATEPIVEFGKGDTRVAFLKPAAFKVKINYTRNNGGTGSVTHDIAAGIAACTWQKLILDVPDVNGSIITVSWDDNTDEISLEPIDVGDPE